MKTILTLALALLCTASTSFSGQISSGNGLPGARFPIYSPEPSNPYVQIFGNSSLSQPAGSTVYGGQLLAGERYLMEFWAGPTSATSFSELAMVRSTTFRSVPATPDALPNGLVYPLLIDIPSVPAGQSAKLGVRVWDTQSGSSFDSALIRGEGHLFLSGALGGLDINETPVVPPPWVGESFSIAIVPEPSSLALAGLGAAALLIFRRRK